MAVLSCLSSTNSTRAVHEHHRSVSLKTGGGLLLLLLPQAHTTRLLPQHPSQHLNQAHLYAHRARLPSTSPAPPRKTRRDRRVPSRPKTGRHLGRRRTRWMKSLARSTPVSQTTKEGSLWTGWHSRSCKARWMGCTMCVSHSLFYFFSIYAFSSYCLCLYYC